MDEQDFMIQACQTMVTHEHVGDDFYLRETRLYEEWARLEDERKRRVPIESPLINLLDRQIQEVQDKILHMQMAKNGYPEQLSLEILKWRYSDGKNKGLPVFMVVDVRNWEGLFRLRGVFRNSGEHDVYAYSLPSVLSECYSDLANILVKQTFLQRLFGWYSEFKLPAQFEGVLPDSTLEKIAAAQTSELFEGIYLIAQVDEWKLEETVRVLRRDPLVVGLTKGKFFIIDKFDLQEFEEYAADQYAWRGD